MRLGGVPGNAGRASRTCALAYFSRHGVRPVAEQELKVQVHNTRNSMELKTQSMQISIDRPTATVTMLNLQTKASWVLSLTDQTAAAPTVPTVAPGVRQYHQAAEHVDPRSAHDGRRHPRHTRTHACGHGAPLHRAPYTRANRGPRNDPHRRRRPILWPGGTFFQAALSTTSITPLINLRHGNLPECHPGNLQVDRLESTRYRK